MSTPSRPAPGRDNPCRTSRASVSRVTKQSGLMKATQGVDSALAPWLQALAKPRLSGLRTRVISGCTLANSSSTAMVPSLELLSTTTRRATTAEVSSSSRQRAMVRAELKVTTTTPTSDAEGLRPPISWPWKEIRDLLMRSSISSVPEEVALRAGSRKFDDPRSQPFAQRPQRVLEDEARDAFLEVRPAHLQA